MTKQDVIRQITARTGHSELTSRLVLESFFEVVKASLADGHPIYIRTFGSFILKKRQAKMARLISQQRSIPVAAQVLPYFSPGAEFRDQVRARPLPSELEKVKK